ncbi:3'-5' exonuclease (plasmid) [Bacillus mycoides]|nr:3'-5' exonuclease [Bacillus mycoides]
MELFKGKVVCPRCDGNGLIYKAKITNLDQVVYICDECDATWMENHNMKKTNFIDLGTFLHQNACTYKTTKITYLGYDWIKK